MIQTSGFVSKTSNNQYRLLTIDGEFLINGQFSPKEGFYSNLDLSNINLDRVKSKKLIAIKTFFSNILSIPSNDWDDCGDCGDCVDCGDCGDCDDYNDCQTDCACNAPSDDCNEPDDCDCDCSSW